MSNFIPLLYDSNESAFISNGIGALSDYIDWYVNEKRNGLFELTVIYPITGQHYSSIQLRSIITAVPRPGAKPEPFRVYRITKPMNGKVKIYAKHLAYDTSGIPVAPFNAVSATEAVLRMNQNGMVENPFTMYTDKTTVANMVNELPTSYRALMGGNDGSILDVYGGEWYYEGYDIYLKHSRGSDKGASIRYGKNLTDLTQEEICEDVYTGILGYWTQTETDSDTGEENRTTIQGDILYFHENASFIRIYLYDLTSEFDEQPTVEEINRAAMEYGLKVGLDVPTFSTELSYEQDPDVLDSVNLCDTIHVYFDRLGIDSTAKVVETEYNGPKGRYSKIVVGSAKATFAGTLNKTVSTDIDESRKNMILESREMVKRLTDTINELSVAISDNTGNIAALGVQVNGNDNVTGIIGQVAALGESLNAIFTSNEAFLEFKQGVYDAIQAEHVYATEQIAGVTSYVRITNEPGMVFGRSDMEYKLKILNNKIFFFKGSDDVYNTDGTDQNGNVVADVFGFFTDKELTVTVINASESIRIGLANLGNDYRLYRRSNGHLTLKVI